MAKWYIWRGIECRMIGEVVQHMQGKSEMRRLDGGICTVNTSELQPATDAEVN